MKSADEQIELIRRGTEQIEPFGELKKKLERSVATGKPLRVKYGIDPTGIDVHLGHTVPLRKLKLFQELGHQAVLIIGNYTALVGDPSGRDKTRDRLTQEQVESNARDYLRQVSKVVDIEKTEVRKNGEWFGRFSFLDVMGMMSRITVQRILERDNFTKRLKEGVGISLHECLYPLMQGHDSLEIQADIELGGSEQLYNLMCGRDAQAAAGQEPQVCLTLPILRGLDGVRRMGKSLGNYIGVGEPAKDQFGKTMSIPDELMKEWFELLTDRTAIEIAKLLDQSQTKPMDAKKILGRDIVSFYYGPQTAASAEAEWVNQFSTGNIPNEIDEAPVSRSAIQCKDGKAGLVRVLVGAGLAKSNNEARQKVQEGAVTIGPERTKVTDPKAEIDIQDGLIIRLGRQFRRVKLVD